MASTTTSATPTSTAPGDLTIFGKYILEQNRRTGSLVSVGLAITPRPAGPALRRRTVSLRPQHDLLPALPRLHLEHGPVLPPGLQRRSTSRPTTRDVVDDLQRRRHGLLRLSESQTRARFLTAVAPTFEVHVNTPLNHRDPFNRFDIAGTPDGVNLTYGLNFGFQRTAVMTFALVTPVTESRSRSTPRRSCSTGTSAGPGRTRWPSSRRWSSKRRAGSRHSHQKNSKSVAGSDAVRSGHAL